MIETILYIVRCVFPIVISSEFRMMQYRDGDHRAFDDILFDENINIFNELDEVIKLV